MRKQEASGARRRHVIKETTANKRLRAGFKSFLPALQNRGMFAILMSEE